LLLRFGLPKQLVVTFDLDLSGIQVRLGGLHRLLADSIRATIFANYPVPLPLWEIYC
jgi:hypothetical protein